MALTGDVYDHNCPSRVIADHVTGRWGSLVLGKLLEGTLRFSALRREVRGVSEKMLAQTLQALERDGLVRRVVHPVIPPHVDYSLTEPGRQIALRIKGMFEWIEQNLPTLLAAQREYDDRRMANV
ncbi:winged helix-turn-helix transcriptional regulator [Saccharothrix coeruleofusca]|uniref:HxlR family transcriptional regulator n=1 Tax=Saccharothrix coeruleofusca TaxID=33919 RepID=A0A918EBA1_9PSEU|nr:helix-turn-helix domain-containing protein [Saccharothrix coeruleofusca]MBP2340605.1 DNA-binding HxlR family transcriptional regulator [Saccharothrix coeruleofusca]GGP34337.1 HxlR family transcriptional regulator [Saccharothrix coeruleofusca]